MKETTRKNTIAAIDFARLKAIQYLRTGVDLVILEATVTLWIVCILFILTKIMSIWIAYFLHRKKKQLNQPNCKK